MAMCGKALAQFYARQNAGQNYNVPQPCTVDADRARRIAEAFEALPLIGADAGPSYAQFARETDEQYNALVALGVTFTPESGDQGYRNSDAMRADVAENAHMYVYDGGDDHAYLTRDQNWRFRAVHDFFGHFITGASFGPNGEERAWRSHVQMYSPLARRAMTVETRGQNSWVNSYGDHPSLPITERPYAVQKAALLPKWAEEV